MYTSVSLLLILMLSSSSISSRFCGLPSTRRTDRVNTRAEVQTNKQAKIYLLKKNQISKCRRAKSSRASSLFPLVLDRLLVTGGIGLLLQVCHTFTSLYWNNRSRTKNTRIEKAAREGRFLQRSFKVHRPVWVTASGAMYTTAGAVYLTLRYLRRLR